METYTTGNFKIGGNGSTVVTDEKPCWLKGITGHEDTEYYGGYLICESVANTYDSALIAEAFNVANETGKTPRELHEETIFLLDMLKKAYEEIKILDKQLPMRFNLATEKGSKYWEVFSNKMIEIEKALTNSTK